MFDKSIHEIDKVDIVNITTPPPRLVMEGPGKGNFECSGNIAFFPFDSQVLFFDLRCFSKDFNMIPLFAKCF